MERDLDLREHVFGDLTVIGKSPKTCKSGSMWECRCSCGAVVTVARCNLKSGNTKSCGCKSHILTIESRKRKGLEKDLTGKEFGRLVVIRKAEARSGTNPLCVCLCSCGKVSNVIQENLLNGHTRSCGCLSADLASERSTTHGKSNTRLYRIWRGMINRCENPRQESYPYYGGRGISVCDEWRSDFLCFYNWAMSHGYNPDAPFGECTIDRINVDGNYCPWNCRWVDAKTQANNKRPRRE